MTVMLNIYIDSVIKRALYEDINYIDTSADYLLDDEAVATGQFLAKSDGVLCGLDAALRTFSIIDESVTCEKFKKEGDFVKKGEILAKINGPTKSLLKGERTALNILQHLSGIATATAECVEIAKGTKAMITDTRKTLPGLRAMQKYAVVCGGGKNHRFNLSDAAMLKDNHIDAAGGIEIAVKKLREKLGHMVKIEVETRNLDEVEEAMNAGAEVIMLDNMSLADMKQAVELVNGKALLEASGNITKDNLREVAETGVDIISLGALTHSVTAFDISMKLK